MDLKFFDVRKGGFTPEVIMLDLTVAFCLNLICSSKLDCGDLDTRNALLKIDNLISNC